MKHRTGFLNLIVCIVALMKNLDARRGPQKNAAGAPCRPRALTALTKSLVEASLTSFEGANGQPLGTWLPGFPELQVQKNSRLHGSKVHCCLLFIAEGLEKVLQDQSTNLNPQDVSLHTKLSQAISRIHCLEKCVKEILRECALKLPPPKMPKHTFERKQWGLILLRTARDYLDWLEGKIEVQT